MPVIVGMYSNPNGFDLRPWHRKAGSNISRHSWNWQNVIYQNLFGAVLCQKQWRNGVIVWKCCIYYKYHATVNNPLYHHLQSLNIIFVLLRRPSKIGRLCDIILISLWQLRKLGNNLGDGRKQYIVEAKWPCRANKTLSPGASRKAHLHRAHLAARA